MQVVLPTEGLDSKNLQAKNVVKYCHEPGKIRDISKSLWEQKNFIAVFLFLWIPRQFYSVVNSTTASHLRDVSCIVWTGLFP